MAPLSGARLPVQCASLRCLRNETRAVGFPIQCASVFPLQLAAQWASLRYLHSQAWALGSPIRYLRSRARAAGRVSRSRRCRHVSTSCRCGAATGLCRRGSPLCRCGCLGPHGPLLSRHHGQLCCRRHVGRRRRPGWRGAKAGSPSPPPP